MLIDDYIKLFQDKGYFAIKRFDIRYEKEDIVKARESLIEDIEQSLSSFEFEKIDFADGQDEFSETYTIFYDKTKVNIELVKSLETFVEKILSANSKANSTTTNEYIYYRGHSSTRHLLEPSIYRKENKKILENEDKLYRDILSSKPHFFKDCNTTLEKLVKMQHHGIPTRLLDLTDNPLIALYFACKKSSKDTKCHGEVLIFNVPEGKFKYYDSDTVSILANLVKCSYSFDISDFPNLYTDIEGRKLISYRSTMTKEQEVHDRYLASKLQEFNSMKKVAELIHFIREDKPYFLDKIDPRHLKNHALVVKPKMEIDRIVNQSGVFVLFGINNKKETCSDFNINKEGYKQKVLIIPSVYKERIMTQLNLFNINDSTVFCDIDSTAKYFTSKYKT